MLKKNHQNKQAYACLYVNWASSDKNARSCIRVQMNYNFFLRSFLVLVNPLLISHCSPVSFSRNAMSQLFALPSVGVARSRIFIVPSGRVLMYSSFLAPGVTLIRIESDVRRGNNIWKLYLKCSWMQKSITSKLNVFQWMMI